MLIYEAARLAFMFYFCHGALCSSDCKQQIPYLPRPADAREDLHQCTTLLQPSYVFRKARPWQIPASDNPFKQNESDSVAHHPFLHVHQMSESLWAGACCGG